MKKTFQFKKGFTLIEVMISVLIFSIVMTVALGALLAMSESDKQAEQLQTVVDNLDFAFDSMSRTIRTGTTYDCGGTHYPSPNDCVPPSSSPELGLVTQNGLHYEYKLDTNATDCGQTGSTVGCIARSTDGGSTWFAMTSPDIDITNLQFIVIGSSPNDTIQPKVTILLSGTLQVSAATSTTLNLETSITQRIYDQ